MLGKHRNHQSPTQIPNQSMRWISGVFDAHVKISVVFAEHGPGLMGAQANMEVERAYLQYRKLYNSY